MSSNPSHTPSEYFCDLTIQDLIEDKIVHDIRNPLSSIISISEMLNQRTLSSDEREWMKRITSLSSQTLDLVRMASDYSKMVRGTFEPDKTAINLVDMFNELFSFYEPITNGKAIHFDVIVRNKSIKKLPETIFVVQGDQFHLKRVFKSLLHKAIELSPVKRNASIYLEKDNRHSVRVHCAGGMTAKEWQAFTEQKMIKQIDYSFMMANRVMHYHQGTFVCKTSPDKGTDFIIELP